MKNSLINLLVHIVSVGCCALSASAGTYVNDFNADPTVDPNFSVRGNAVWRPSGSYNGSGYVSLTDAIANQAGTIVLPDFDGGIPILGFNVRMKVRIGGGTARPGDGMSISFADASDSIAGGGTVGEEGTATGLSLNIDTYDNGNGDGPAIDIKVDGAIIAHKRFAGTGPQTSTLGPDCAPVETDGAGNPISLETDPAGTPAPGTWVNFEMNLSACGALTVNYKGLEIFKDVVTGYAVTPVRAGRFVIAARTSGATDNHWIDDLAITTVTGDSPPRMASALPVGNPGRDVPETSIVRFVIDYRGSFYQPAINSIRLTLDGTDITSNPRTRISDDSVDLTTTVTYTPSTPYAPSSRHEAVLTFSDEESPPVFCTARKVFYVTPVPATNAAGRSLFIEAEDFNYMDTNDMSAGHFFDFGSTNGSYAGKAATHDVDYHLAVSNPESPLYRVLNPPNGISLPGTPDNLRAGVAITPDFKVSWNDAGDWYNFTRTFPNATYKIYGRFSSGGVDTHVSLAKVTSDPTIGGQTTASLGTFDGEATGGWDTFCFIPLRDTSGNEVMVRLNGLNTLRVTTLTGNDDFNYLAFVKMDVLTPTVESVEPRPNSDYARTPRITAVIKDEDSAVVAASLKLTFDGTDVTASSVITDTASGAMILYQAPLGSPLGTTHSVTVEWQDNQSTPVPGSFTWSYQEGIYNPDSNLFIEMEDFNSDFASYYPSTPGHPFNEKGLYNGLGAVPAIDYNDSGDGQESNLYRTEGVANIPHVNMLVLDDSYRTGAGARPGFTIVSDHKIGWTASGGPDWYNYTRNYGGGNVYNIYLRASHGNAAATIGGRLELVNDPVSATPTLTRLGDFRAPATGGSDTFTFIPLKTSVGNLATVTLSGEVTLRYSVEADGGDINYLMLCPVCLPPEVLITNLTDGAVISACQDVTLCADAQTGCPDATIVEVTFFANGNAIGTVTNSPFCFTVPGATLPPDAYTLTAEARDSIGQINGSLPVALTVRDNPPINCITCPSNRTVEWVTGVVALADFNTGDGGCTVENINAPFEGPWTYNAASGTWSTRGQGPELGRAPSTRLICPAVTVGINGRVRLSFNHRYSFEADTWDGGQVRVSVNGGGFAVVPGPAFVQNGYNGSARNNTAAEINNQAAYVETSAGYGPNHFITSVADLGFFTTGDVIRVLFLASFDTNTRQGDPAWEIDSLSLTHDVFDSLIADSCDTNVIITVADTQLPVTPPSVLVLRRTWTATDDCTNSASCSQTITYADTTRPVITCSSNVAVQVAPDATSAAVTYSFNATDNYALTSSSCTPPSGSIFPLGVTTVNCVAADGSGNTNACSFTVTVTVERAAPDCLLVWKFDETSGLSALDSSGNNNNGVLVNGPVRTNGILGQALRFDGFNDRVVATNSSSLNITSALTIAAWIRPETVSGTRYIAIKGSQSDQKYAYSLRTDGARMQYRWVSPNGTENKWRTTTNVLVVGQWIHVAAAHTPGNTPQLFINSLPVPGSLSAGSVTGPIGVSSNQFTAGSSSNGDDRFQGSIDEVFVCGSALVSEQIRNITNGLPPGPPPPLGIATASPLARGRAAQAYSQTLVATGGTPGFTWSLASGALPAGLTLNTNSGAITGTPATGGTNNFRARVRDTAGQSDERDFTLVITNPPPPVIITASPLPSGILSNAYSTTLAASNGLPPNIWTLASGSPPDGVTLNTNGVIHGTPTSAGTNDFRVRVTDALGRADEKDFTLAVVNPGACLLVYKFDEASGNTALDSSGNGNSGTLNGPSRTTGIVGRALRFDGSDDRVNGGNGISINHTGAITVAAWVRPESVSGGRTIAIKGNYSSDAYAWVLRASDAYVQYRWVSPNGTVNEIESDNALLRVGRWTHVAVVHTPGTGPQLYTNWVLVASSLHGGSASAGIRTVPSPFAVGASSDGGKRFQGLIDEVFVCGSALSTADLRNLMAGQPPGAPPLPIPAPPMTEPVVVEFRVVANTATLVWTATPGQVFRVQYKNSLADEQWYEMPESIIADDVTVTLQHDRDGEHQRFYQIVWKP